MKILFVTIAIKDMNGNGLYVDLIQKLRDEGHEVFVICANERRNNEPTSLVVEESVSFLRVKTGNITKTNFIEKGISTILIEQQFIRAIKEYYNDVKFDLILYTTPPVTFARVINFVKSRDNSVSYLILKDIFPQNAIDLELIKENSFIHNYFKKKEKKLYEISDYIGCTSVGNIKYIIEHNNELDSSKVELFPNSISPRKLNKQNSHREKIREKYGIPVDSVLLVYGGNIGRPQGIEFIKEIITEVNHRKNLYLMIVGSGTDFTYLSSYIHKLGYKNVNIRDGIPKDEYWEFLSCCDVGLIFLDNRFTVPNTPARLTYYMEASLPILAATDKHTDIKDILEKAGCGFWVESGDLKGFYSKVDLLLEDEKLREKMGENGRNFMEKNLHINVNYNTLMSHVKIGD